MFRTFARFWKNESGTTAVEFGLIAALVALAIMVAAAQLGTILNTQFLSMVTSSQSAN